MGSIIDKHQDVRSALADTVDYINTMPDIIESEEKARIEADEKLKKAIDAESEARVSGDENVKIALDAEVSARTQEVAYLKSEDSAINARIDNEVAARLAGDSTITEAYQAADTQLQKNIDAEVTRAKAAEKANSAAIGDEALARTSADAAIETAYKQADADIVAAYQAADQNIVDQTSEALTSEQDARAMADQALSGRIDAIDATLADVATKAELENETARATASEQANADAITEEATKRSDTYAHLVTAIEGKMDKDGVNIVAPIYADQGAQANSNAFAIGMGAFASGNGDFAIGKNSKATIGYAIGYNANSSAQDGMAIGTGSTCTEESTISFGNDTTQRRLTNVAEGVNDYDVVNKAQMDAAIGAITPGSKVTVISPLTVDTYPTASSDGTLAIGDSASAEATNAHAFGNSTYAWALGAVAVGSAAKAQEPGSVAVGSRSKVSGGSGTEKNGGIAVGYGATSRLNCVAIGASANCKFDNTVAIGCGATATKTNQVFLGSSAIKMFVSNVADPVDDNDAVNKSYLDARISASLASYLVTIPDIEHGYSSSLTIAAGASASFDVTFATAKTEAPQVLASVMGNGVTSVVAVVQSATATGCTVKVTNLGTTSVSNVTVDWLALSAR